MKVSVVIPNWNGQEKLKRNLPKVLALSSVDEIIVVDDKSSDGSVSLIEKDFPQVKLIKKDKNSGFATTVNLGVAKSVGDLVFLLNTDAVPEKQSVTNSLAHFSDPKVFSVSANTGGSWSWAKFESGYFWHYQAKEIDKNKSHQTLWASGGSGIFKKAIWDELLGFDEIFNPFYEEDVDLGYRATKRGYINIWDSKVVVEHYKEPGVISLNFSKERVNFIAQRNQLFFIWKNITSKKLFAQHKKELLLMLVKHPKYMKVFLAAVKQANLAFKKRAQEQKQAKLSDEAILEMF